MSKVSSQRGFTLVEIIVGIVVLAIALTLITSIILPAARQSVTPVYQVRAAELGQSMLNEVLSRSFDEQSDRQGGQLRCGEQDDDGNENPCTASANFGPDGEDRDRFDDVDDYHLLADIETALGDPLAARYPNFSLLIEVCYSDAQGNCGVQAEPQFKRILVRVTTPEGQNLDFSAIRGNF
ncbi:type IV pilus modification PilV family protein [Aliidiomarina sp. Khilg15.8]